MGMTVCPSARNARQRLVAELVAIARRADHRYRFRHSSSLSACTIAERALRLSLRAPRARRGVHVRLFRCLLALLTFFLGLGRQAITDSDEAFYAEAAREMVEIGRLAHAALQLRRSLAEAGALLLADRGDISRRPGRRSSARGSGPRSSGLGLVLLTWHAARRSRTAPTRAWLAGAITATCYGYFAMARAALPDLPLTFFITLGIWAALERRWAAGRCRCRSRLPDEGPGRARHSRPRAAADLVARGDVPHRSLSATSALPPLVFAAIGLPWYAACG